ncbi:sugar ABC transporter ATP-binding protein [Petroclostridium sp. X23]|uniref:sugar ABC transporter ATP-binding protein n=1 Tax=Petroclostridium sp. X23 TaxID=3045146 RepID=UPI0024AD9D9A|nr:sugar ABC transporter ATP-binding protein [Petroclostridium sp. X23]WHH57272.1 sugar ABC transporter ATP-binding protein [Petroclostridium sp. X23]
MKKNSVADCSEKSSQLLKVSGIRKSFGGNHVLKGVDFALQAGEVHAILGGNGAGKSTFIKILSGALTPDAGKISFGGKELSELSPNEAFDLGIATIYQETSLYPDLSVAENLFVGREIRNKYGFIDWKTTIKRAEEIFERLGVKISPFAKLGDLGKATAQLIEIGKALSCDAKILIMDEPTASLSASETERLFQVIEKLKFDGTSIIYISHRLEEVFEITDRITVLRDGIIAGTVNTKEVDHDWVVEAMIGRRVEQLYSRKSHQSGEPLLQVKNITCTGAYENISFTVHKGEIVALAGLVGSGRTEIARAIFGIDQYDEGKIIMDGKELQSNTLEAIECGIAMVPEDRGRQGLILNMTAANNFCLSALPQISNYGVRNMSTEKTLISKLTKDLVLHPADPELPANAFSGGNQQKVVIGRCLAVEPRLLILDEPTCGVDVGAKSEIYRIMSELVSQGMGILLISSDLPEVEHIADRIIVMQHGRIVAELNGGANSDDIFCAAIGKR